MKKALLTLPFLLNGCMSSFVVGASIADAEPPVPMGGGLFDLCVAMGAFSEKNDGYLRVLAFFDMFPSLGLDIALLPLTIPAFIIWG